VRQVRLSSLFIRSPAAFIQLFALVLFFIEKVPTTSKMRFTDIILAGVCVTAVCAIPSNNHVVHEKRTQMPKYWEKKSRIDPDRTLPMRIGLTQSNLHKGDELLMEV